MRSRCVSRSPRHPAPEFYDSIPPYCGRHDIAFFVELARQAPRPVHEIGCDTGRVLIPTARAGVEET